jgi:hypothetical protein
MPIRFCAMLPVFGFLLTGLACGSRSTAPVVAPAKEEEPVGPALFDDVTAASGINFAYRNGETLVDAAGKPVLDEHGKQRSHLAILESLGGGVALIDYDGDGLLDIYIPGGGYYSGAPEYHSIKGHAGKLYRNLGGFKFDDVTAKVGLDKLAGGQQWFYSHGAAVTDYDRDGWPDLLVTGWGGVDRKSVV